MRAVVTKGFHHPTSGVMLAPGYAFENNDAELQPVLDDPELAHRVAVTDRTPQASARAADPMPAYDSPKSVAAPAIVKE